MSFVSQTTNVPTATLTTLYTVPALKALVVSGVYASDSSGTVVFSVDGIWLNEAVPSDSIFGATVAGGIANSTSGGLFKWLVVKAASTFEITFGAGATADVRVCGELVDDI